VDIVGNRVLAPRFPSSSDETALIVRSSFHEPDPPSDMACDAAPVPDGFDVRPETLRRAAAELRTDAGALENARATAGAAAQQAAGAAGSGPLTGAAQDLAAGLDQVLDAVRLSIDGSADALDATAAQYLTTDGSSASRLDGIPLPGLDPPG
jgi:hypothetical protein